MKRTVVARVCLCNLLLLVVAAHRMAGRPPGGFHTGNLLHNPSAQTGSISPWVSSGTTPLGQNPWTQWTVSSTPVTVCATPNQLTISSSDGSPWFKNASGLSSGNASCYSCCAFSRHASISQTISVPTGWLFHIQSGAARLQYGGDAFAAACSSGNGASGGIYYRHPDVEATITVEFLNSSGGTISQNSSGALFGSIFACFGGQQAKRTKYGFLKQGVIMPAQTTALRFTADYQDGFNVTYPTSPNSGGFTVGFDNLLMDIYR